MHDAIHSVPRPSDDEIRTAHTDGYVACVRCGHNLFGHDEQGCISVPGCACPLRLTTAQVANILAAYFMTVGGTPMVHYRPISDDTAFCGLDTGADTPHRGEPDYTLVTCPACLRAGKPVACPRCAWPTTDPASHCPECGDCDCLDRGCLDRERLDPQHETHRRDHQDAVPGRRATRAINADARVKLADIVHDCTIWRYTDTTEAGVIAPLPCHGESARRQAVTVPHGKSRAVAICRTCSRSYLLELVADSDGGHWALFELTYLSYLLSRSLPS